MLNTVLQRQLQRSLGVESVDIDINIGDEKPLTDDAGAIASPIAEDGEPLAEAQQVDLAEEENEVEDTSDNIDDADQDVETLESLISVLQMGLENNSTDPALFKAVNVTMDHIARTALSGTGTSNDITLAVVGMTASLKKATLCSVGLLFSSRNITSLKR